jgi:glutathione S-transferase
MGQVMSYTLALPNSDFFAGAFCAFGTVISYYMYKFLQVPSIDAMIVIATKPVPKAGDDNQITIWGFQEKGEHDASDAGVSDISPYVLRVENYLKLHKKDYVKKKSQHLSENPRGKVPLANIYGTMIDDSHRILLHLQEKFGDKIDMQLTEAQRTQGLFIRRLLTCSTYFVILYEQFATKRGRKLFESGLKKDTPGFIIPLIKPMIIRSQMDNLHGLLDKYPPDEVIELGKADLRALNSILGDQNFFLGMTEPTIYDTDVYSFVSSMFFDPWFSSSDWIKEIRKELPSLEQHCIRMRALLSSDSKKDQ